jgi:hypothetical protein
MEKSKEVALLAVTTTALPIVILLFAAATTIVPLQQAYSLSKASDNTNPVSDANGKIYQPLEQEPSNTAKPAPIPTTTTNSSIVPVGCAMDTIESLESFLSCLGAK